MGPMNPNLGEGLFPEIPPGKELPIDCTYKYGPGASILSLPFGATEALYSEPIPVGWEVVSLAGSDPEVIAAGFTSANVRKNGKLVGWMYLRDDEGKLVATWDEGRWWTPEEAEAFLLALKRATAARDAYGIGQDTPKGGIEWQESGQ